MDDKPTPLPASPQAEAGLASVLELVQEQLKASARREAHLASLLETALSQPRQAANPTPSAKPVSAERPILLSSATMADFVAWEEAWQDYARCQHLNQQDPGIQLSALRQALDEDLRRFIREGIIVLPRNADIAAVITVLRRYIRRQRNPLLDRIVFYQRHQQPGESFDSFYTALNELFKACDFPFLCSHCCGRLCSACRTAGTQRTDTLRDRVVIGVLSDETRHKLLAMENLTLDQAIQTCRAEEAASQTGDEIPGTSGNVHAARRQSTYRRQKAATAADRQTPVGESQPPKPTCPNCGRSAHTKKPCPALGRTCNKCQQKGHFQSVCSNALATRSQPLIGRLQLQRTHLRRPELLPVSTQLTTEPTPVSLQWIPDTGSDVDAIGIRQLKHLGGFLENIDVDEAVVFSASGSPLENAGCISATLKLGPATHSTVLHVFYGLDDALLSRDSLKALKVLPRDWPHHVLQANCHFPSVEEIASFRSELLTEFADVFDDSSLQPMHGPPMTITLTPDAKPSHVNGARAIPFAYREQIKAQLDDMLSEGIIETVSEPCDWCHPIVVVNKKGTSEKRLTVDLRRLNDQVCRPTYPTVTPRAAISAIGEARFFSTLDARHGYWQIPLSDTSKPLTTFITPWGRYRFCRNPQGLISAGDEFNRRTDTAFSGLEHFAKVVDDCLVHDTSFDDHLRHVRAVLQRAREHGITFSAKKFVFGSDEVPFCGYIVNSSGWTIDSTKTAAIRDFPIPCNRTDLRSFLGLVNQCSAFTSHLADFSSPLRPLLKTTNEFLWDESHTTAFNKVKSALVSPPVLAHFQLGQPLRLETDASVLNGLGYALWQQQGEQWCLLECGSRFLSDAESRYAVIELECLAVVWAVKKCSLFLQGSHFDIVTDHRPLIPILNSYHLDQIENPRLQRLVLKLRLYQFRATWRKGTSNSFADALSRHPVCNPTHDDELGEDPDLPPLSVHACLRIDHDRPIADLRLHRLQTAAQADSDYQCLVSAILTGFPDSKSQLPACVQPFWNGREHLSVDDGLALKGQRIIVPRALRRGILQDLHASHQGLTRTKQRARQLVYWPNITNDINNIVQSCPECRLHVPSQQKEPMLISNRDPVLPFESTSADLFSCQGWQYLVYTDRKTGWPCISAAGRSADSPCVIRLLRRWFPDVGVPQILTTDGGPQFASQKFADFCAQWQIHHVFSTPHYPQSNGHAEAAVKAMKALILKTTRNGNLDTDAFQRGLLEWRNTPREDGTSPAEALYGRPMQSFLFAHRSQFDLQWRQHANTLDKAPRSDSSTDPPMKVSYDRSARPLSPLALGSHVDVQHPVTKLWSRSGVVVDVGRHRDYQIKLPSGRLLRRNRRFIRPRVSPKSIDLPSSDPPLLPGCSDQPSPANAPRRGTRSRQPTQRFNISSTSGQSYD